MCVYMVEWRVAVVTYVYVMWRVEFERRYQGNTIIGSRANNSLVNSRRRPRLQTCHKNATPARDK